MANPENTPQQKVLAVAMIALALSIIGTAAVLMYLGLFNSPSVAKAVTPAYRLVYLDHKGPYNKIDKLFEQVEARLHEGNITPIAAAAIFYDDPSVVPEKELRSKVGYLISEREYLPNGVGEERIPPREIVQAVFDGSPVVGSYKSYTAMKEWARYYDYNLLLPSLEIYYDNGEIEYQLPISPK